MRDDRMIVRSVSAAMGAEILDVDLNDLADGAFARIRDAFHTYQVIVIRDQNLTPAAQLDFSSRFGALEDQLNAHYTVPDYPEVLVLSNDMKDGTPIGLIDAGGSWH